jgi:hypothetical protein
MTNPLMHLCLSFDCSVNRVQLIVALGKLRQMGFVTIEDFDSADDAESLLTRADAISVVVNKLIAHATQQGRANRVGKKRPAPASADVSK